MTTASGLTADALFEARIMDEWPSCATIVDFALDDQQHYEALYYPIHKEEITLEQLRLVSSDGKKITELVNACESNPHKGIVFKTSWDAMREYDELKKDKAEVDADS